MSIISHLREYLIKNCTLLRCYNIKISHIVSLTNREEDFINAIRNPMILDPTIKLTKKEQELLFEKITHVSQHPAIANVPRIKNLSEKK